MAFAVATHNLRKVYAGHVAVSGLSLQVAPGEVFGFLGPNGAGKSTSVKMLLGLIAPSGGSAELLGKPIGDRSVRARVGFLPEHFRFYDWLTAEELLQTHGRLAGMSPTELKTRVPEVLETVGLAQHSRREIRKYSKGMLQRAGLAQAILHRPDVLFLDEPTSGLDPVGRKLVREVIRAEKARGTAIFLNSHLLSEVETVCDRVAFIRAGRVIETRIVESQSPRSVFVRARRISPEIMAGLEQMGVRPALNGDNLRLQLPHEDAAPEILRALIQAGADVFEFTPSRESLEEHFLRILGEDHGL